MPTAFITHPSFLLHEMGPYHPECPERLTAISDRLIAAGLDPYVKHYTAPAATREQLARVHGAAYIDEDRRGKPEAGLHFIDPDTALNPHSLTRAQHAAGAVVHGVDLVMRGECATAFCAVRPPGHHAERRRAMGFCIFNNVAVGAAHALAAHGLTRVAIVDFDVHHGNGTEDIFQGDPRVLMVSTFQYPLYPYCGVENQAANMVNSSARGRRGQRSLPRRRRRLAGCRRSRHSSRSSSSYRRASTRIARIRWPVSSSPRPTMRGSRASWWRSPARHAQRRIVSTLEGGYALSALGRSAAEHIRVMVEA
jgi:acetoin utilization deacetylase AcuC-like enzyme